MVEVVLDNLCLDKKGYFHVFVCQGLFYKRNPKSCISKYKNPKSDWYQTDLKSSHAKSTIFSIYFVIDYIKYSNANSPFLSRLWRY